MPRDILHCDMNNFYASVECMLDPALKNYPVAVCGSVEERHGIVLAKNYKAKAFQVQTGDAVWQAQQKCPGLVVVPPHYEEYIKYPSITKQRMFYETMEDILPDMKVIIEGANGSQIQQLLPLDSFNTAEATEE